MRAEVIAASAGTGKTYRLAEELKSALMHPDAPIAPERVVAVTFTRDAAAELAARVRRALLDAGSVSLARRLAAARVGTIHSVCARLVRQHAFHLGLSPELRTLDEHLAANALRTALEHQLPQDERALLDDLEDRLGPGFTWQLAVKDIIDCTRLNGLAASDLDRCADRSVGELLALLPASVMREQIEVDLLDLIDKILAGTPPRVDDAREEWLRLHEMRSALRRGELLRWRDWLDLAESHMMVLRRFGDEHVKHPQMKLDLETAVRAVFAIAGRALERYEADKRAWGVFDFVDQETFALQLLRDPKVRPQLKDEIGLVLVDEFQDTSPLQLAILSEMTALAEKTILVGDQKQAIYGFRGTDPSLMEAVVTALASAPQKPLDVSHRSRPGLVALTSALFAPAFESQGIPAERVVLRAHLTDEPDGLGPFLERWKMEDSRSVDELASGIFELLDDQRVYVRERGDVVLVRPRHIAVLARTNRFARDLATALSKVGVPAQLRRRGLCSTVEARAVMAGLALFCDGKDRLAAAELSRLTRGATDANTWLAELVTAKRGEAFANDPFVAAIAGVAGAQRDAGVVLAYDLVVDALRLRDICAAWGDTAQRLANLGAIRALAVRFVEERRQTGASATVAGFLARLEELGDLGDWEEDHDDEQGDVAGQDAVDIVTWHKAKGREWPIVILAQLVFHRPLRMDGVRVESDAHAIDLANPLARRWVRYWPTPYGDWPSKGGVLDLLATHPARNAAVLANDREELRLLYVGWTRARDRLILTGPANGDSDRLALFTGTQSLLRHLRPNMSEPGEDGKANWAGVDVELKLRSPRPRPAAHPEEIERSVLAPRAPVAYPPASLQPSAQVAIGEAGEPIVMGTPFILKDFVDEDVMARLGSAVHAFFAADPRENDNERYRLAEDLLARYDVRGLLETSAVVEIADRIWTLWPLEPMREVPVAQRLFNGTVVRGIIDLMFETQDGIIIVDHKTYAGVLDVRAHSAQFAGQLKAYADAVSATGLKVASTWIHLPLSGVVVPVKYG